MVTAFLSLIGPAGQMVRGILCSDWLLQLFTGASFPLTPPPATLLLSQFTPSYNSDSV